ncbi:MAG: phenylalanine--tRNA ligase subunit beta [Fibrobacterota bacterium]
MKAPYLWLKEFVNTPLLPEQLAETFTFLGLEVDGIEGGYSPRPGIVVGRVLENRRHPNADKLSLNKVDVGNGQVLDIVCGAANVRAGLNVVLIRAGHTLPDGFAIKESKIRGELSQGMICSEKELGLAEASGGILELREGLTPGEIFSAAHFDCDPVFEVAVLPNRPDCLSIIGLARELAAKLELLLSVPAVKVTEGVLSVDAKINVEIVDRTGCPRYMARYISGLKVGPSPDWMVKRLAAVGVRSINNIVDITNYVLMEYGHPLHAFDYAKVAGGKIIVRRAMQGEAMPTLDGNERTLSIEDLLICDAEKPVALAGVMGGAFSEVSDSTTEVLLEAAYFDPVSIRKSARRHGMSTEASYRFERGADPGILATAIDRACELLTQFANGTVARGRVDVNPGQIKPLTLTVRTQRVNRVLGSAFSAAQIKRALSSIGLVCGEGDTFSVTVPTWRPDVTREADCIEEAARLIGYDKIADSTHGRVSLTPRTHALDDFRSEVRLALAGFGLSEAITNTLVHPEELVRLQDGKTPPMLLNPLNPEMSALRTSLLPSMLQTVKHNKNRNSDDLALFEIGRVFNSRGADVQPEETERVAAVFTGRQSPCRWDGKTEDWDMYALRGLAEAFIHKLTGRPVRFPATEFYGCPGVSIELQGKAFARILSLGSRLLKAYDIKGGVWYVEMELAPLFEARRGVVRYRPLSKFPPSDRDIAVVTDDAISADEMMESIRRESPLIESVAIFDVFKNPELGAGRRSAAFAIRMRKNDGTLTDAEVDGVMTRVLGRLKSKYKAELR